MQTSELEALWCGYELFYVVYARVYIGSAVYGALPCMKTKSWAPRNHCLDITGSILVARTSTKSQCNSSG